MKDTNELTIAELEAKLAEATKLKANLSAVESTGDFILGDNYFLRCITYHYTGTVVRETDSTITLDKCCWIADSGRFADAIEGGKFSEVEPYGDGVMIFKQSIVDAKAVTFKLPTKQV